ncbi:cbb3-type cytochrome oxidase assembly protein CcoS [Psychroflexus gondwanensis]|jgi:cbb3-type cytochrome oxidase maturation protein|uniref:Cytochrome cbb3 oxidase maturation (Heme insertion) protein CcoS n=1 Tax=Psychroflexus gondwanensis ACAM 44 TaxID=1189619 RepID=N1WSR2_9FLAO|nr:cbb3-type cytochrome oxidase assembly protein CcoS [Psychroflexus gondwanensis]EMY82020.1 cytochrome cbb3 oxidase maturation (heme insertion) protein CcoS [Psychroflexus gondwanensis ACAM 44]TXE16618.1 cbb3-type cytochrome oxidase assembly protein CcoS [Psychroflexus gondwanensis]
MSIIYLLISVSVLVAIIFFIAFVYSVKKGQYDDTYTPSVRMLFDNELVKTKTQKGKLNSEKSKKDSSKSETTPPK